LIWAIGALYFSCTAIRLARFNVSNKHGEQHHFSFLGLPSPGAAGAVVGLILMQQDLSQAYPDGLAQYICVIILPAVVLFTGLLMISHLRYPHLVNRYLRGRRSIGRLILVLGLLLLLFVAHRYVIGIGTLAYALWGPTSWAWLRIRPRHLPAGGEDHGPAGLPQSSPSR
jgi:CDP-diacylglycerol--serine O-phosphatidyltransferase